MVWKRLISIKFAKIREIRRKNESSLQILCPNLITSYETKLEYKTSKSDSVYF